MSVCPDKTGNIEMQEMDSKTGESHFWQGGCVV